MEAFFELMDGGAMTLLVIVAELIVVLKKNANLSKELEKKRDEIIQKFEKGVEENQKKEAGGS